jgi:hypothetical protein
MNMQNAQTELFPLLLHSSYSSVSPSSSLFLRSIFILLSISKILYSPVPLLLAPHFTPQITLSSTLISWPLVSYHFINILTSFPFVWCFSSIHFFVIIIVLTNTKFQTADGLTGLFGAPRPIWSCFLCRFLTKQCSCYYLASMGTNSLVLILSYY